MPEFEVTSPQGKKFIVTAPEGASQEQVLSFAQAQMTEAPKDAPSSARVALQSAAKGAAAVPDMFLGLPAQAFNLGSAGIGYAAGELGRPDITANMPIAGPALTQPVRSGLEAVGAISPEFEPQTAGQRVIGRALEAAPSFAMSPTSGLKELGGKLAVGALSGGLGQATEELTGSKLAGAAVSMLAPLAVGKMVTGGAQKNVTQVKSETLKEAREAGYVVPPASVKPTAGARVVETVAGRAATAQDAALRNQEVTNTLAKKALGLPKDAVLTEESLEGVRKAASVPYQEVAKLSPVAASALERLKESRFEMNRWFKFGQRTGDPTAQDKARAFQTQAETLERVIEKSASAGGKPELVTQLKDARKMIAKSYDVERALNVGDGNISARAIGRMLDQGKPLTGELKVIGRFAQAFPAVSREAAGVPSPAASGTDAASAALLATLGYGGAGTPGTLAGGLPLLRTPARNIALSQPMQNRLIREPQPLGTKGLEALLGGRAMVAPQ